MLFLDEASDFVSDTRGIRPSLGKRAYYDYKIIWFRTVVH
jgi:hypothetical protein